MVCTDRVVTGPLPSVFFLFPNSLAPQKAAMWNYELFFMTCCKRSFIPVTKASHAGNRWTQGPKSVGRGQIT